MHHLLEIWSGWVLHWGYLGIVVLMAMESSIFPVPSEVVIPPAAFLAAQGHLNFWGVIVAGTVGSYLGAAITYWISRALGRALIVRYGRWFLHRPRKTRTRRNLAESLRDRGRLFCAIAAGGAPSDLYSGRNRAHELCRFQHRNNRGFGDLVHRPRIPRAEGIPQGTATFVGSRSDGSFHQNAIVLDRFDCARLDAPLPGDFAVDQARFQIRQWCSKRRHECRRFVYLGVTVERSAR